MQAFRLVAGSVLMLSGLMVGLLPLISVWRVSGQVLDEIPSLGDVGATDTRHRVGALADPDFILARRTYENTTPERVRDALVADGFASFALRGEVWYGKECCGQYDGVWVSITESPDGPDAVRLLVTTADGDVQPAVGVFGVLGLVLFLPGAILVASGRDRAKHRPSGTAAAVPDGDRLARSR